MRLVSSVTSTVRAVASEFSEKNVTFMAGSIAYNAFVSLAPLLIVLLLAVGTLGASLEREVLNLASQYLPPAAARILGTMVVAEGGTGVSVIGVVVTVWGSLKIFRNLDTAFSEIFESDGDSSLVDQVKDGLIVLFALIVGVVGMVLATATFAYIPGPLVGILSPVFLLVGLCVAFFPLFYVFPDVDLEPREVLPGVVVAAVGWAVLQVLFQVYVVSPGGSGPAALLGTLILVVTWLYFSGIVLLLGAVVNAVLTGNAGDVVEQRMRAESATVETDRELAPAEAGQYLSRLRESLTRRYEGMRPTEGTEARPHPAGPLHIEEQALDTDDGEEWEVTIRYPSASGSASDD